MAMRSEGMLALSNYQTPRFVLGVQYFSFMLYFFVTRLIFPFHFNQLQQDNKPGLQLGCEVQNGYLPLRRLNSIFIVIELARVTCS